MKLKILLPKSLFLEAEVQEVVAEGLEGLFALEPRHADYISSLVPSILTYVDLEGRRRYVAVDEGLLVKRGEVVLVATFKAIASETLEPLKERVQEEIQRLSQEELSVRKALARLEAGILHRYRELERLKG